MKILREGGEDSELFDQLLLDEPDGHDGGGGGGGASGGDGNAGGSGGGSSSQGFGLVQFVEHVQHEAAMQLTYESGTNGK